MSAELALEDLFDVDDLFDEDNERRLEEDENPFYGVRNRLRHRSMLTTERIYDHVLKVRASFAALVLNLAMSR